MTPAGTHLQEFLFFGGGDVDRSSGRRERRLLRPSDSMDPQGTASAPATVGNEDWRRLMRGVDRPGAGDRRRPVVRRVDHVLSRRSAEAHRAMVGALGKGHRDPVRFPSGAALLQLIPWPRHSREGGGQGRPPQILAVRLAAHGPLAHSEIDCAKGRDFLP
jgi:hypothetical protein